MQGEESIHKIIGNAGCLLAAVQMEANSFRPHTALWEGSSSLVIEEGTKAWRVTSCGEVPAGKWWGQAWSPRA